MSMHRYAGPAVAWLVGVAAVTVVGGCVSSNDGENAGTVADGKLDPLLRRYVAERPDSVIGVLVRTVARVDDAERAELETRGLAIGSVVGTVVTGRIRAAAAPAVARLSFVEYMEAARRLRPVRPPPPSPRSD